MPLGIYIETRFSGSGIGPSRSILAAILPTERTDGTLDEGFPAERKDGNEEQGHPVGHLGPTPLRVIVAVSAGTKLVESEVLAAWAVSEKEKHHGPLFRFCHVDAGPV